MPHTRGSAIKEEIWLEKMHEMEGSCIRNMDDRRSKVFIVQSMHGYFAQFLYQDQKCEKKGG